MKKFLFILVCCLFSIVAYADYTAQCKKNSSSYVVASQQSIGETITVRGYGDCANSTVIVEVEYTGPTKSYGTTATYTCDIKNGTGTVKPSSNYRLRGVSNIVCSTD